MSTDWYTTLLWVALLPGFFAATAYLVMHRPRRKLRAATINADAGFVIIWLLYARSVVVLGLQGHSSPPGAVGAVVSVVLFAAIDALVVFRLLSFLRFRSAYRAEQDRLNGEGGAR